MAVYNSSMPQCIAYSFGVTLLAVFSYYWSVAMLLCAGGVGAVTVSQAKMVQFKRGE